MGFLKGQSSIEYLTTYGWMLVAVSLVGGTMYTYVDLGGDCQVETQGFSPPFPTIQQAYQYDNETVLFELQNPREDEITIDNIQINEENRTVGSFDINQDINGEGSTIVTTNRFQDSENCFNGELEINYRSDTLQNLTATGQLQGQLSIIPLIAVFDTTPTFADPDQQITFNASESEGENNIESYNWNFGDGNTSTGNTTTHNYSSPGVYTVTLEIEDSENITDTKEKQVYIGGIIRALGGTLNTTKLSNSLATGCIGDECPETNSNNQTTVRTNRGIIEGTLYTGELLMLNDKLCITSAKSLNTDEGCLEYKEGDREPLSQENNDLQGTLTSQVIEPLNETNKLCIGKTGLC